MKTPPFLLLAALLFWGQQTGFLIEGAVMGVLLECPRFIRWRWELDDTDFNRIFTFCVLLTMLLAAYVFTNNDQGGGPAALVHSDAGRNLANSTILTSTRFLRWGPMIMFPFILVQIFNVRDSVPLTAVSLMLRWRRRKGDATLAGRYVNVSFGYFIVCLFSAGIHPNNGDQYYFWGIAALVSWALWSMRSGRYLFVLWTGAIAVSIIFGFLGQFGINRATSYIQNFNAEWMARFFHPRPDATKSITSMGQIGELQMSDEIVIWVQPREVGRVPAYLREASYRTYHSSKRTWFAGTRSDFVQTPPEPNQTSYVLLQENKTNPPAGKATVNIACFLNSMDQGYPSGLLPLPSGSRRLDNVPDLVGMYMNPYGAVLADGRGFLLFDATYAPGATIDAQPEFSKRANRINMDLEVPTNEVPALDKVIAEMGLSTNDSSAVKERTIERFFLDKFTYSTYQGKDKEATTNASPLTRFLLTSRSGHCEYFATATVLLLRELHVPARYAVGYAVHETRGSGYVVRDRDAHAWCLAWNAEAAHWEDFDTTPPSWVSIEGKRGGFWQWLSDLKSWLHYQFASFRWGQAHLRQYIIWALVPVMAVLLYHIIFRRRGKLKARPRSEEETVFWPGLDSEFYQLEKKLAGFGLPRQPNEALTFWLERVSADPAVNGLREPLQKLLRLHYRHRFDPQGLNAEERAQLRREAKACLDALLTPASK